MAEGVQIAAFEGGQLRTLANGATTREAVLALPLNRMIVRMVRVPAENREDPIAFATPILQAMSPYPDEPLTVSLESVREQDGAIVAIAAALPESATDDIGEALDGAKLNVTRIDALAIGALRGLWNTLGTDDGARRLILLNSVDCISVIVLDGDSPSAIRAVNATSVLKREMMLSLLEAEDFGGAKALKEIVVVESGETGESVERVEKVESVENAAEPDQPPTTKHQLPTEDLETFAPVRKIDIGEDAALVGVAERSNDPNTLNALPQSWREVLDETRFKAKMVKYLAIAGGIWALLLGIVFGVPFTFGLMTDHQKQLCKEHKRQFEAVSEMKSKVELVQKYSDHARGSLEIMKAVSDRLPGGITLGSWGFKREDGVKVVGEAETADEVYQLKDAMDGLMVTDENGAEVRLFPTVKLNGPTASKGKQKFDLECSYETEEQE